MDEINESAGKLRHRIEKAFGDSKPPSVLVQDDTWDSEEHLAIVRAFLHRKWQDISCEAINPVSESLSYLTPEAFRYYLPALMLCSMDFNGTELTGDCTIYSLTPPDSDNAVAIQFFEERIRLFTQEECGAIRAFLEYVILEDIIPYETAYVPSRTFAEMDKALDYWPHKC